MPPTRSTRSEREPANQGSAAPAATRDAESPAANERRGLRWVGRAQMRRRGWAPPRACSRSSASGCLSSYAGVAFGDEAVTATSAASPSTSPARSQQLQSGSHEPVRPSSSTRRDAPPSGSHHPALSSRVRRKRPSPDATSREGIDITTGRAPTTGERRSTTAAWWTATRATPQREWSPWDARPRRSGTGRARCRTRRWCSASGVRREPSAVHSDFCRFAFIHTPLTRVIARRA